MADEHVFDLIEEATQNKGLRRRMANDRTASELAESANKAGFSISEREAKQILAGAYLTADDRTEAEKQEILGGLAWGFLDEVEKRLERDFSLLDKPESWQRSRDFYENVFGNRGGDDSD